MSVFILQAVKGYGLKTDIPHLDTYLTKQAACH